MPETFLLRTFGCKTNQYESQALRESLLGAGYVEAAPGASADIVLINSCAVTARAGASCRRAIHQARRAHPAARIVLLGCAVDTNEPWIPELDAIDLSLPNPDKGELVARLRGLAPPPAPANPWALRIHGFDGHSRGFVKIQDGCDAFCAYCIIPKARGVPRSRPRDAILEECRALVGTGHVELVLTGINIGLYSDTDGTRLPGLVRAIAQVPGLARLRLGSVEPNWVDADLLQAMAAHPVVCPHLHIPLQAGSDAVLRRMNRVYSTDDFRRLVDVTRHHLPHPGLTTDVIVGFPGETDAAFHETRAFCREIGFSRMHVFPFSKRTGTAAAGMGGMLPERVLTERRDALLQEAEELAAAAARSRVGCRESILPETHADGMLEGYTARYMPARVAGVPEERGTPIRLTVTSSDGATLLGERKAHSSRAES